MSLFSWGKKVSKTPRYDALPPAAKNITAGLALRSLGKFDDRGMFKGVDATQETLNGCMEICAEMVSAMSPAQQEELAAMLKNDRGAVKDPKLAELAVQVKAKLQNSRAR